MPKDPRIKKVLVIGSGPIIIGQAAEFDYSGTQACRALKAEGIETVLLNSNPATIMTDPDVADHVYIEPMTLEVVERILEIEKPDSVLPNLGGQMGLNLSMELARSGYLDRTGIRLLACKPETIDRAEDRELFKETMEKLHQPIIPSEVVETLQDALACADRIGYPVIVRPAFTMGGTGGGICENKEKLIEIGTNGLRLSPIHQILVEKCIAGWKEIEYEVMRDHKGNVITVCNMENLDPVGIHTGDSVVVAPSQPLTDHDYMVRGCTALLDAIGGAIHHIGNIHKYARQEDIPEHTMFVITTDGMENASRYYSSNKVKQMIERQKIKYGWEFLFLGANIDAVETASLFGIDEDRAVNYQCDSEGTALNYEVISEAISAVRCSVPLGSNWKKRIDEDFKKRGNRE